MNLPNAKTEFIECTNQLLHEQTAVFFYYKDGYPIDQDFLEKNASLAGALYDSYLGKERTREEEDNSIDSYCLAINSLLETKAREKAKKGYFLLPDIMGSRQRIKDLLIEINSPSFHQKKRNRIALL